MRLQAFNESFSPTMGVAKAFLLGASALIWAMSCSINEQPIPTPVVEEDMGVTLTATVGTELETRAAVVPDGYRMRYVLEVRAVGTTDVKLRLVQTDPSFSFLLARGGYDFLMWADYIESDAADDSDLYYDTSKLNAVVRKTTNIPEVNTEALDAFSAVVTKTKTDLALDVGTLNLVRPFARINLVEKTPTMLANVAKIEVDYATEPNQAFDVQADAPVTAAKNTATKTRTILNPSTEDATFFYDYLFAPTSETTTVNYMTVRVYTGSKDNYTLAATIPIVPGMPYQRNKRTDLTAKYAISSMSVEASLLAWNGDRNTSITNNPYNL